MILKIKWDSLFHSFQGKVVEKRKRLNWAAFNA